MILRLTSMADDLPVSFALPPGEFVLGSAATCDLVLTSGTVSRRHARILASDDHIEVTDLDSKNGVWFEGKLERTVRLTRGQVVKFGTVPFVLQSVSAGDAAVGIRFPSAYDLSSLGLEVAPDSPRAWDVPTARGEALSDSPWSVWLTEALGSEAPGVRELMAVETGELEATQLIGQLLTSAPDVNACTLERKPYANLTSETEAAEGASVGHQSGDPDKIDHWVEMEGAAWAVGIGLAEGAHPDSLAKLDLCCRGLLFVLQLISERTAAADPKLDRTKDAGPVRSEPSSTGPQPIMSDPGMADLYRQAQRAAQGLLNTVIIGETGTGKELLAQFMHSCSSRADKPFVAVNCAALPRDLLESELFGIERGVATGVDGRAGKFERADGGTLFLDEIGDMSIATQAMILRVLQEKRVHRIGSDKPHTADVWVLAATHRDLGALIEEGAFRSDLYFRLAAWRAPIPPLRDRPSDIPHLAVSFASQEAKRQGKRLRGLSRAALDVLESYEWPGNVRQLQQEMKRAVTFTTGRLVETKSLSDEILSAGDRGEDAGLAPRAPSDLSLADLMRGHERREIEKALAMFDGDVRKASKKLGLSRSTMYRRLRELEITL